jgi:hypothetical protein
MGTIRDIYFLESERITKMAFFYFKHTSLVLLNLVLFLKEFVDDYSDYQPFIHAIQNTIQRQGFIS